MAENAWLRARVRQLELALSDAATSLENGSKWSKDDLDNQRQWLRSRAWVARRALELSPHKGESEETMKTKERG